MVLFSDTPGGPGSSGNAPQVRSATPVEPTLPVPNHNTALDIPTRADWVSKVSPGEALSLIPVYRAITLISTSVMQLSFDAYRSDEEIDKPHILRKPDPDVSLSAFLEMTTMSLASAGNAFWRVFRDNQGRVTALRVLNPHDVVIETDSFGLATGYRVARYEQTFTKAEVKHLSHTRVPGDPRGRGPIQAAQAELHGALDARDYAAHWFQDAGVPTGILTSTQPFNELAAQNMKEQWKVSQGGTRGTAVLGGDWKYSAVYLSPEDAQWVAVRQYDTTNIARLFGVPAHMLLAAIEGSAMTYANVGQVYVEFARFTLARYVVEIEDALSDLLPRGTEVKANYSALLAPDAVTRYDQHTKALQSKWMSVNEVRDIEGLPAAPDGDFPTAAEKAQAFEGAQLPEEADTDE